MISGANQANAATTSATPSASEPAQPTSTASAQPSASTNATSGTATAAETAQNAATVTLTLANQPANTAGWSVGETMSFSVTVTNKGSATYGFQPTQSNLSNYADCKWRQMTPNQAMTCSGKMTHTVTQDDVTQGGFTPSIQYTRYTENDYKGTALELPAVTSDKIAVVAGSNPAASSSPSATATSTAASTLKAPTTTITIANPKGEGVPYTVGEKIQYNLNITNNADVATSFAATAGNKVTGFANCKYTNIAAGGSQNCTLTSYTVTAEDAQAGSFTPSVTWTMYNTIGYPAPGTAQEPTKGPVISVAKNVASLGAVTLTSTAKDKYNEGDQLKFSVTATNNTSTQPLTFVLDDSSTVKGTCPTTSVKSGANATCGDLTYTLTNDDLVMGKTTATVVINAKQGDKIVQQLTGTLEVKTEGNWPQATKFAPHDADPRLDAALTTLTMVDTGDSANKIRIPTITVASNGDLLASYDQRPLAGGANGGDSPNANWIVQRRSTDGGKTWGPRTVIAQGTNGDANGNGRKGYSDPSYVVDYNTGTIFNFHVYSQKIGVFAKKDQQGNIITKPAYTLKSDGSIDETNALTMNLAVSKSTDNGYTWTTELITDQVLRGYANQLQSCFATSGGGTQVQHGKYAGRLLQQLACVKTDNTTVFALTIYSDNDGQSWHAGQLTSLTDGVTNTAKKWLWNENKVVELSDGTLMLNSRTAEESTENAADSEASGYRIVATSDDGGVTWKNYRTAKDLTDPGNNAMIIRAFPNAAPGTLRSKVLLFSNTNSTKNRTNGTISVSYDDGQTWTVKKEFRAGGTGYTSMAIQPNGSIGVLMEPNGSGWSDIGYVNVTLSWIDPSLQSEIKIEPQSKDTYQKGVDGETVKIPVKVSGDDPKLADTVTLTGLPDGFTYDAKAGAIVGTPQLGNTTQQTYNAKLTITEAADGTDIPREATYSFVFVLAPKGGSAEYSGRTWYVNADKGSDANDGLSEDKPFKTLNPVNQLTLLPGDKVLLHRGDTFNDQYLHVKGSGSAKAGIEIGAYGDAKDPKPVINANGSGQWYQNYNTALDSTTHVFQGIVSSAILLKDVEYVTVRDLEVTNQRTKDDPGKFNDANAMDRTGVAVIAENAGTIHHVTIENMYIHDVDGNVYDKHMANGGIYVIAHKPLNEAATGIARFDGVNILNNRVERVTRWGIGVGYTGYTQPFDTAEIDNSVAAKYGQTNVVVRGNYVKEAGGDSITVFYSLDPVVEYNVSQDGARYINTTDYTNPISADGKNRGGQVAAAIWSWKSKDALFQYNESFNELNSAQGNGDGMAWDADWGDGTVYQYNYSHGNSGGAVMFCGEQVTNSTFRFNISDKDLGGLIDVPDQLPEAHVYNNTFVIAEGVKVLGKHAVNIKGSVAIENNIFYYTGKEAASASVGNWTDGTGTRTYDSNLYYNFASVPTTDAHAQKVDDTSTAVMVNPNAGPVTSLTTSTQARTHNNGKPSEFDGFKLAANSPAANTGKEIVDHNGFALESDFFGTKITGVPDIGAVQADGDAPAIDIPGTSLAQWKTYNEGLADYKTLQDKLADTSKTMTWLFTGDSITHGVLHTNGLKRYTEYFEDYLRTDSVAGHDRSKDVVLNTGVSSADTSWLVKNADSWVKDRQADVVFMTFGMNDGRMDTPAVPVAQYKANLQKTIDEVRAAGGIPVLMTQNFTKQANFNKNLTAYFDTVRDLAKANKVMIIDFNRWWVEHNRGVEINADLMSDDIHPNQEGHLRWAQLIMDTLGMNEYSRLAQANQASVPETGRSVVIPDQAEDPKNFAGSTGLAIDNTFLAAPKKAYANSVQTLTEGAEGTDGLSTFAAANEGNLTIRFKLADGANSDTEMVLAAFGDSKTGKQLTLSVGKNQMRLGRDYGTGGYGFFSFYENDAAMVNDGKFHILSVNIGANKLQAYVDGVLVKNAATAGLNLDPARYSIDTVTLGGALTGHQPANTQNAQATIDYVQAFNRSLTAEEIGKIAAPTPVADGVQTALTSLYNNTTAQMWSFLGGATTQGTTGALSAKNYVQAIEEVLRWEHGATPEIRRMKFVENAGLNGLNSAGLLQRYRSVVADQKPTVVFIAPDVMKNGKLVETNVASFKKNIQTLVSEAKAAGAVVVLMTPAQLGTQVADYAQALKEIAESTSSTLVDATAWLNNVVAANDPGVVQSEWYDSNQMMTAKGQLELAKYIMETIHLMPADISSSKIWALNYDGFNNAVAADAPTFVANRKPATPSDATAGAEGGVAGSGLLARAGSNVRSGLLAHTGADVNLVGIAALLLAGAGTLALSRRRHGLLRKARVAIH